MNDAFDEPAQQGRSHPQKRFAELVTKTFKTPKIVAIATSIFIILAVAIFSVVRAQSVSVEKVSPISRADGSGGASASNIITDEVTVFVHVVGAVKRPGVVELASNSRVRDALEAAGGATDQAAVSGVNLARIVTDGEQLRIPTHDEFVQMSASTQDSPNSSLDATLPNGSSLINLNVASSGDLESLPGIGPALARRIVDWRSSNGGFKTVDDLDSVSGIGEKLLDQIRELVTV